MKSDFFHLRGRRRFGLAAWLLVVAVVLPAMSFAEDAAGRAERFDGLIEAMNAPSERRARVLETIYGELRGPNSREMQEVLRESLFRKNSLILQGVVEAMAMLGDADDLPALEALLATSHMLEVKTLVIRLLPTFCLGGSERARFNYIRYGAGYERIAPPEVLEPLRRPPLTRRGRLNTAQERLQNRVSRALSAQFDPVGAALRYLDDRLYSQDARAAIVYYTGNVLGNDPGQWTAIWASQGNDMSLRGAEEVEEIRLAALQSLSDMGAEGLPELIQSFGRLLEASGTVLEHAAFEAMAVMCRNAFADFAPLMEMHFGIEDAVEAENWRRRRLASAANLAVFAAESAEVRLERTEDAAVFGMAATCLGAALSFPDDFPDPAGVLSEAKVRGVSRLERLLLMPDLSREQRTETAHALGEIGNARAVSAIDSIVHSPYCSPELESDGMRMAEAAVDALREIAVGTHDGRDAARRLLLGLLRDPRLFEPLRPGTPPVGLAHMVLWRLQRLAKSNETALEPEIWRMRLGW